MPSIPFAGSIVALVTPFTRKGAVDYKALSSLIEWQIAQGTDGIVCTGTTGESCTLSDAERIKIALHCVQIATGRIPIIAGTGTCNTDQSVRLTAKAQAVGASGCLAVTPYYNKPTQRGCLEHFRSIARVGLPVIAYHNPGRAVVRLNLDTIRALGEIPGIVAIKESSGDLEFVKKIRSITELPILSGDDDLTCGSIQNGAVGAISVIGNIIPRGWKQMIQAALSNHVERAQQLHQRYLALCKGIFLETNPQCAKYLVSQMGRCKPVLRLPLVWPTQETQDALRKIVLRLALPHGVRGIECLG